jgi:exodeoxyribonuclease VII small subunit
MGAEIPKQDLPSGQEPTFEEALARLEAIVHDLEEGQISLADGLARYEEGDKLLKSCYQTLEQVGHRIELVGRVGDDGTATCEPFDVEELSDEDKAQTRGRRRSRPSQAESSADGEIDGPGRLF